MTFKVDNPIITIDQDVLQRAGIAERFALQVCRLDASEGSVVGVFGPWGSGKTSFINLAKKTFESEDVLVLDFNPWLFSGAEQLVGRFVTELSAQFKLNSIGDLCNAFLKYGDMFSGKIGMLAKLSAKIYLRQHGGIQRRREKVASVLRRRNKPIIVVLDDVDRLSAPEIREIFKLVRLTASFPNLVYIVCCDRLRVEQALNDTGVEGSGSDYLEKIIQLPFNMPEVPRHRLAVELYQAIEEALVDIKNTGPVDEHEWMTIFKEIIHPLVRNMRDVRRYSIAVRHTLEELDGRVARNDVLALEAVRLFLPGMFTHLPDVINTLTIPDWFIYEQISELKLDYEPDPIAQINKSVKLQVESLINSAGGSNGFTVATAVVDRLFPAGEHIWEMRSDANHVPDPGKEKERLRFRRVAHAHIFRLYLERVMLPDLEDNHNAEHVISLMADRDALTEFIHSLEPREWNGLIRSLDLSNRRILNTHLESLIIVLLERWSEIPNQLTDWVLLDRVRSSLEGMIGHFLSNLDDIDKADDMVTRVLNNLLSLSPRVMLVEYLRSKEDSGSGIASETVLQELENMLQEEIIDAPDSFLKNEPDLLRILYYGKGRAAGRQYHTDESNNELTISVLLSAVREKNDPLFLERQARLPVGLHPALDFDGLVKLYGNREFLKQRVDDLEAEVDELIPWIERRVPFDDFKVILALAEDCLNEEQPEKTVSSA